MTSNQKIQVAHEVRMWTIGLLAPLGCIVIYAVTNPTIRNWFKEKTKKFSKK